MMTPASLQPAPKPGFGVECPARRCRTSAVPTCVPRMSPANFFENCDEVHVVGGGAPEDLRVRSPAEALVALRAVGGHADKVGALAPEDVAPELVDHGAAGVQVDGERRVGVKTAVVMAAIAGFVLRPVSST